MGDNSIEIERLRNEIQRANSEISRLEHEYERRFSQELNRIKSEFAQSTVMQQRDFSSRFKQLEKFLCDAYLFETEKMKNRYDQLIDQVSSYEAQLESQIQQIVQEQFELLKQKANEDAKVSLLAQQSILKLNQRIQNACQYPVDLFYPRALQRYIDAGKEAEHLLQLNLYSLALAKADCTCMSVDRLTDDTATKVHELESMFELYSAKLNAIRDFLASSDSRRLLENNEAVLELSEIDLDYWSDLLYSDLQAILIKHQDNINGGVGSWLASCRNSNVSPTLLLDKEMQKLDALPSKLNICITYALSACDCYNYLSHIKSIADGILSEQNYSFKRFVYGAVKPENCLTNGYNFYYDNYLVNEKCVDLMAKPDYREERILIYEKAYPGGKIDQCRLYIIPIRTKNMVSLDVFIQFDIDYLPTIVTSNLGRLFLEAGLEVKVLMKSEKVPMQINRPLSLEALKKSSVDKSETILTSKYSLNI